MTSPWHDLFFIKFPFAFGLYSTYERKHEGFLNEVMKYHYISERDRERERERERRESICV
jgi:hypothetical protein